jgi:signal transduction histidine kinase
VTNPYLNLFYTYFDVNKRTYGIVFWINIFSTYLYVCFGTIIFIKYLIKTIGNEKKQSFIFSISIIIPLLANIFYVSKVIEISFDITPIGFGISLLFLYFVIFRYRFLNAMPVALQKVYDTVEDAIILIDNEGHIVSSNCSFNKIFYEFKDNDLAGFVAYIKDRVLENKIDKKLIDAMINGFTYSVFGELTFDLPEKKIFMVSVHPVLDKESNIMASVVSFTDITSYRSLVDEFSVTNDQLMKANEQLRQHMKTVEELAVLKERNRVAREIHDSLGHTMTLIAKIQEVAVLDFGQDNEKMLQAMKKANEITKKGIKELRQSLYNIVPERTEKGVLKEMLNQLAADLEASNININITFQCDDVFVNCEVSKTLFRVCQEAVTNSIKHGGANEIHIILQNDARALKLFIIDNGKGCMKINKGYGLLGMEERLANLDGAIAFGSDGESGFNIRIQIPLEREMA